MTTHLVYRPRPNNLLTAAAVLIGGVAVVVTAVFFHRFASPSSAHGGGAGMGRADGSAAAQAPSVTNAAKAVDAGAVDPGLNAALAAARTQASAEGIDIVVNDTYRSAAEQTRIFEEEVAKTGSVEAARQRVFPAEESMHVRGLAIDLGSGPAADWLEDNGRRFGLCRTLEWEWWHFEWRADWETSQSCPRPATVPDEAPTA